MPSSSRLGQHCLYLIILLFLVGTSNPFTPKVLRIFQSPLPLSSWIVHYGVTLSRSNRVICYAALEATVDETAPLPAVLKSPKPASSKQKKTKVDTRKISAKKASKVKRKVKIASSVGNSMKASDKAAPLPAVIIATKSAGSKQKKTKGAAKKITLKKASKVKGKAKQGSASETSKDSLEDSKLLSKKETKQSTAKRKRKAKKAHKTIHWRDSTDPVVVNLEDNNYQNQTTIVQAVQWCVRGNPLPLRRHRTSRGFVYNPSAPAQASFRNITEIILKESVPQHHLQTTLNGTLLPMPPIFPQDQPLAMTILFRMKRPNLHFLGNKPGPGRLRESAPSELAPTRTDVDNLAKFILDSLNGILYEDDRQINSLHVTKLLDTDGGLCQGSTEIYCRPIGEADLPTLVRSSSKRPL